MSEFEVHVDIGDGVGRIRWDEQSVDAETLQRVVSTVADEAMFAHDLRRLQVDLLATDTAARRAVQRCGFRLEGTLRAAHRVSESEFVDVVVYARLAVDPVYGPHGFSGVMDSVLPKKRLIGHVLFRDGAGRVLLLETTYKSDWELPGGVIEPNEPPRVGCAREVLEELGIEPPLGTPALIDWLPPYLGWSDAVEFIWDGGTLAAEHIAAIRPEEREISAVHWVAPEDVAAHVTELSARRIALILSGYRGLTEDGVPRG